PAKFRPARRPAASVAAIISLSAICESPLDKLRCRECDARWTAGGGEWMVSLGVSAHQTAPSATPSAVGGGAWSGGRTECIALGATVQAISRCARHPVKIAQG